MPTPILMPKLSDDMREGKILAWKKKEGDKVEPGEVIAEVETDKSNLEIEAYNAGTLVKIVAAEGATVPCGQPIAEVAEEGEEEAPQKAEAHGERRTIPRPEGRPAPSDSQPAAAAVAPGSDSAALHPSATPHAHEAVPQLHPTAKAPARDDGARLKASPLAKRMAKDAALDLRVIEGSGPGGRVVKADVERAMSSPAPNAGRPAQQAAPARQPSRAQPVRAPLPPPQLRDETVQLSGMRRTIARRMAEAKPGAPHFYLSVDVEMSKAMALRADLNEQLADEGMKISVNDLILRAAALALLRHPAVNASYAGDSVERHGSVHLGFAVSVEDGLLTPVIRDADRKPLAQLSREARELAERARARKLKPDEYQGGTFTVSNLGMYGIGEFSAIINPGEAAILAVGATEKRPVVRGDAVEVGQVMTATLSGDHRVIDGALGAQLLRDFKAILEQPLRMVV